MGTLRIRKIAKVFLFCVSLSICSVFVSENLQSRFEHRDDTVKVQQNILKGQEYYFGDSKEYFGAWQNRVIFPSILWASSSIGIFETSEWYIILRILSSFLCFLGFWWVVKDLRNREDKLYPYKGTLLLFFCLILTFTEPWSNPTDYFDSLFFTFCAYLVIREKYVYLFMLSILAAANRESSAFFGVVWAICHGFNISKVSANIRELAKGIVISVASYASALGLRLAFGGMRAITDTNQTFTLLSVVDKISDFLAHPKPFSWPVLAFALLTPPLLWIWEKRSNADAIIIKLLVSSILISLITLMFGMINEIRIFIPSITLLVISAVLLENN